MLAVKRKFVFYSNTTKIQSFIKFQLGKTYIQLYKLQHKFCNARHARKDLSATLYPSLHIWLQGKAENLKTFTKTFVALGKNVTNNITEGNNAKFLLQSRKQRIFKQHKSVKTLAHSVANCCALQCCWRHSATTDGRKQHAWVSGIANNNIFAIKRKT